MDLDDDINTGLLSLAIILDGGHIDLATTGFFTMEVEVLPYRLINGTTAWAKLIIVATLTMPLGRLENLSTLLGGRYGR